MKLPLSKVLPQSAETSKSPSDPSIAVKLPSSSRPSKFVFVMKFATPEIASEPYVAAAPSFRSSIRSSANIGIICVSAKPSPGDEMVRRPFIRTRLRLGPRLRRLMEPVPGVPCAEGENWFESPRTEPTDGRDLMNSSGELIPVSSSSAALKTSTGRAESSGVPAMKEPVTTTRC